ncbi:hypothetical protein KCP75_21090 [Salmonella enterica subsp. enterica]|nr:hypothetical protein KCP75_21090 [Salmonella enterica subsp. enterica]
MTFNSDARNEFCCGSFARLRRTADLRQLFGSPVQQNCLRRKAQRLALLVGGSQALFQIAELMRQSGLGLVQHPPPRQPAFHYSAMRSVFRCFNFDHEESFTSP